jgi:hypothetical protein
MYGKGLEGFKNFDICPKCAEPVMKFLKTKKLIKELGAGKKLLVRK